MNLAPVQVEHAHGGGTTLRAHGRPYGPRRAERAAVSALPYGGAKR
jgi:hypothetical protein